ncbi:MAG: substrate-binding domain-containing protein, partial [Chloroflexota bacterium]
NSSKFDLEIPLVYLTMEPRETLTSISVDNYLGGRLAMAHLLEQGYQHIGHIAGPLEWWEARQRMQAWKDALIEARLDVQDRQWVIGNWSSASGAAAIEKLFDQYPEMDAVFAANDQMALSAIQFIRQKGLCIPENIGIVGFDNLAESAFFSPALTTIQQDQHKVAKLAVAEIIKIIESDWQGQGQIKPQSIILPPTLVVRQSSQRLHPV